MPFRHTLKVRYGEVDQQRIVFNANYLAYVDDACDMWFREAIGPEYASSEAGGEPTTQGGYESLGFDFVLKRADITWSGAARWGDELAIDVAVRRWGNTSFDVGFEGSVGERPVFEAVVTYVSVTPGTTTPAPVPERIRTALG